MEDIIETRELRLVGSDGKQCAVIKAGDNHSVTASFGNLQAQRGIELKVDEDGIATVAIGTMNGQNEIILKSDPKDSTAVIAIVNERKNHTVSVFTNKAGSGIHMNDQSGNLRLILTVGTLGEVIIQQFSPRHVMDLDDLE